MSKSETENRTSIKRELSLLKVLIHSYYARNSNQYYIFEHFPKSQNKPENYPPCLCQKCRGTLPTELSSK